MATEKAKEEPRKKTTLQIKERLWREASHYGIDHGLSLQGVVDEALEAFLKSKSKGGGRGSR